MTKKIYDETWQAYRLASLLSGMPQCAVCGRVFTLAEWDDRHDGHKPGCSRDGCDCDYPVHADCCEECKDDA